MNNPNELEDLIFKSLRDRASKQKSGLQTGDIVILNPKIAKSLYDGFQFNKDQYKELDTKKIKGKIIKLAQMNTHYQWGEYASVEWENGTKTDSIHSSWLKRYDG